MQNLLGKDEYAMYKNGILSELRIEENGNTNIKTEKSLILSVSAGTTCYRHIQINENATLMKLHSAILFSFGLDSDHQHSFFIKNRDRSKSAKYINTGGDLDDANGFTKNVKLSKFNFNKDDKFLYRFDFSGGWRFQIKVLSTINELTKSPYVLKKVGELSQYNNCHDN